MESYEKRDVGTTYIEKKDDIFHIKFYKTISEAGETTPEYTNYKLSILETDADNIAANETIESMDLTVYARITNESMITDKDFNKYVRLFTYSGSLNRGIRTIRTSTIASEYNIDRIYFTAVVKVYNSETHTTKIVQTNYYIESSELSNN